MKKSKLFCYMFLCLMFSTSYYMNGQEAPAEFRKFGVGASFQPFGISNILEEFEGVPLTKINFAINATKVFRVEMDFGMFNHNDKSYGYKTNAVVVGVGLMGTKRMDANVLMGGLKFDYTFGKEKGEDDNGENYEDTFNRIALGPVLAYEHLFGGRLGVGAELGLKFSSFTFHYDEDSMYEDDDEESTSFYTDSAFFVRFYF